MRTLAPARLLLGSSMLIASLGLLLVGLRDYLARGVSSAVALDGASAGTPAEYLAPWVLAVVLVAASLHLLRGIRDRVL